MKEIKYSPDGYLSQDMEPKRGDVIWMLPWEGSTEWILAKSGPGGINDKFPMDYPVESYRGHLRFPGYMTCYKWKPASLEESEEFNKTL